MATKQKPKQPKPKPQGKKPAAKAPQKKNAAKPSPAAKKKAALRNVPRNFSFDFDLEDGFPPGARSRLGASAKAGGKSSSKGRSEPETISFTNPAIESAFNRAVKKYPNAFRRLTD